MTNLIIGVIVQARIGSTRLPGKVLLELDKNEKVLDILIERLKLSKKVNKIIIATVNHESNAPIIDLAKQHKVSYFLGDEYDVLARYFNAAEAFNLDIIIRVTSDCPFVDPMIMDDMITFYLKRNYDYIRNVDETTNFSRGFDLEIFNFSILKEVYLKAKSNAEREHVTYYIYTHPNDFKIHYYNVKSLKKYPNLRLTIDETDDLIMCRTIYQKLKELGKGLKFSIFDIYNIIENNPKLLDINKHIVQKKVQ